jgi:hypothetical protein
MPEDKFIMHYVELERARCAALSRVVADQAFLTYCIENSVQMHEIEDQRERFDEFATVDDDIESLM